MYVWYCYICDVDVNMSFLLYELINDIFCSAEWKDFLIIVSIYIQLINTKKYKNTRYIEIIRWRLFFTMVKIMDRGQFVGVSGSVLAMQF